MDLDKLVAVSGLPGLYRVAANRSNGMIIANLDSGKKKLAPTRKHDFTLLGMAAVYINDAGNGDDATPLKNVFRNMMQQIEDNPPLKNNAKPEELREYFADVLPNYDRDRVHISDMKKITKWFKYLNERNLLTEENLSEKAPASDEEE